MSQREQDRPPVYRILLVEDHIDNADAFRILLQMLGHEVEVAYDGTTALEMARRSPPDVIFCDIGLPGELNGFDVARHVRRDEVLADTPLIALTAYSHGDEEERSREAGFMRHLTKPVLMDDLASALRAVEKSRD